MYNVQGFWKALVTFIAHRHRKTKDSKSKTSSGWPETETEGCIPTAIGIKISSDYMRMLSMRKQTLS